MANRIRKLMTKSLGLLPAPLRHWVIRNGFRLSESELARVESVHIARTVDEYVKSMGLVYDGYVTRGIMESHESKVRMTPYLALPTTVVFVAIEDGKVAGTLSLIKDGPLGLPMQKIYAAEIDVLRKQGRKIAEVGALCVAEGKRHKGIPFLLYKALYLAATQLLGIDDLVIAVHPNAADLYKAMLDFKQVGPRRDYPNLTKAASAVALRLDLRGVVERYRAKYGHLKQNEANPYWMYIVRVDPQIRLPAEASVLENSKELHRKAMMKLAALRPDIVLDLPASEFDVFRKEMGK